MGAMKNWAMASEELHAAREHWEQCDHAREQAVRAEVEAHEAYRRARAAFQEYVGPLVKAARTPEDARTQAPEGECEETCVACGLAVSEDEYADTPRGGQVLHDACRAEWEAGRAEDAADARADARADEVLFGYGRGTM